MFVRFKRRRLKRTYKYSDFDAGYAVDIVLVESRRDAGRVRQVFVGYVASYTERLIAMALHARILHRDAGRRLESLVADRDERLRLLAVIEARIPRPTADGEARERAQLDRLERSAHRWNKRFTSVGTTKQDAA
jgi:hypothetical protein